MNRKSQSSANDDPVGRADCEHVDEDDDSNSDSSEYILRENEVKNAWDTLYLPDSDQLLFFSRNREVDLSAIHPNQVQIFKLWQIYIGNFDPLMKVTHTPTLQARIVDAAMDVANIEDPSLEALMFSIYTVAIFSLSQAECIKLFQMPREDLLARYQLGTKEALLNAGFLKTGNLECLTALHFYLMSVKPLTDPRSLSAILGVAIRIAQRMNIHDETANGKHQPLEAELRRRLWWSLVLFDARISEMTEFRLGLLLPTWDCKTPSNVSDFDLRPEMKTPPEVSNITSEALFAVVRSELGDFLRHSSYHLDFINPALKPIAKRGNELDTLERSIEGKYLQKCDPQNPLHYMTIWWARGQIAKYRFIKQLSECSKSTKPAQLTDAQRDAGFSYALTMLECDSKLMTSKAVMGYRWLVYLNFPFPAYVHVVQDLRRRPLGEHAQVAWEIMSENCAVRFMDIENRDNPMERKGNAFFKIFAGIVLQAWSAREAALAGSSAMELPPLVVTQIKSRLADMDGVTPEAGAIHNLGPAFSTAMDISPSYSIGTSSSMDANQDMFMMNMQPQMGFGTTAWGWPTGTYHQMLGNGW
ncbi:hypothetical protein EK21DRAFT_79179 [Setomelanomma holmii]|uniref:Xylanolytic transcriptional activator regulatory domain-containing protein n=1 Tax=Setomelanomma holmii TaxID=210430 RepID=A0A9P4GWX4_9PLEO|nr:hypothetical protein EK21DRAFT_79179 [Setomelanomma holmii]